MHWSIFWNSGCCQDSPVMIVFKVELCQSVAVIIPNPLNICNMATDGSSAFFATVKNTNLSGVLLSCWYLSKTWGEKNYSIKLNS